jgi:hypothetical protein
MQVKNKKIKKKGWRENGRGQYQEVIGSGVLSSFFFYHFLLYV